MWPFPGILGSSAWGGSILHVFAWLEGVWLSGPLYFRRVSSTTTMIPAMISQASMVDSWPAVGRGSFGGGGGFRSARATTMASATNPAIQNA